MLIPTSTPCTGREDGSCSAVARWDFSVTVRLDDSEGPWSPLSAGGTVPMDLDVKAEGPTTPHELHAGDFQAVVFAESTECK